MSNLTFSSGGQELSPAPHPPRGRYLKNESGLWYLTRPEDPNHPGEWVSDPIRPRARVYIEDPCYPPRGAWAVEIEFSQADRGTRRSLIRYGSLHEGSRDVIARLAEAGVRIAADRRGQERFVNYLVRVRPPILLRLGKLTVQGVDDVLCLRAFDLAPDGGAYAPQSYDLVEIYDGGRKLPPVVRILDDEDTYGDVI